MSENENKDNIAHIAPLLGGLAGGSASTILLYPLDLIKVRLQVNEEPLRHRHRPHPPHTQQQQQNKGSNTANDAAKTKTNRQRMKMGKFMFTLRGVVKHEGITGLYQGLTPAVIANAISWGGYFFFYEGIKKALVKRKKKNHYGQDNNDDAVVKLGHGENFGAACSAGLIMVGVTNPLWLIKTRMQLQMKNSSSKIIEGGQSVKLPYRNLLDAGRTIVREEGLSALYKGAVPAMMLVSHGGVQFVSYEYLKGKFGAKKRASNIRRGNKDGGGVGEKIGVMQRLKDSFGYLTMGAASKIIASTTTYPLQVIKARLQQRSEMVELSESGNLSVVHRHYQGLIDCIRKIWQKEGITGFFKGNIPNAIRVAPSAAITFVVYEGIMDMIG